MIVLAHLLFAVIAVPAVAACLYLLVLSLLSATPPSPSPSGRRLRFDVMVPAHNEAALIERCLASLRQLDWPADCLRLWVVADNCDDTTAQLARKAGARVLERHDPLLRSKGHALCLAFGHSRDMGWADAVVVVDADTEVSPNLLEAFAWRIESGAGAVQAHYGVRNAEDSWRTGLMAIAHGAFHGLRSQARERLQLSCGLRGNGWCVTHRILADVPYQAVSVTEDLEYGIALGLAGQRVHYAAEARVNADMESGEAVARRQRQRWEGGRFDLMRSQAGPLLLRAVSRGSGVSLDLALDLMVLPLSYLALQVLALVGLAAVASGLQPAFAPWLYIGLFCGLCLLLYVLRGWQLSGRGARGLLDLLRAPFYLLWKLQLLLQRRVQRLWVPTRRRTP
jgi:cellulose synthase/poly-beta-1,6-N-acetylglucosamine synthase-like glycosyltransferase